MTNTLKELIITFFNKMKNLFLRDASILLNMNEVSYSNNLNRLKKTFLICENNKINIQITIGKEFYLNNKADFDKIISNNLKKVKTITIHLTTSYDNLFSNDVDTKFFTLKLLELIKKVGRKIVGICIHPDHINSWKYLRNLNTKNNYLAIEVTDKKAKYGNKISQIQSILKNNKFLKVVIDTSHIKELAEDGVMTFDKFYKEFKNYIVEAQISDFGNFYKLKKIKTSHSLLHLNKDKILKNQIKLLKKNKKKINFVIEGLIPFEKKSSSYLKKEIKYIKKV